MKLTFNYSEYSKQLYLLQNPSYDTYRKICENIIYQKGRRENYSKLF